MNVLVKKIKIVRLNKNKNVDSCQVTKDTRKHVRIQKSSKKKVGRKYNRQILSKRELTERYAALLVQVQTESITLTRSRATHAEKFKYGKAA